MSAAANTFKFRERVIDLARLEVVSRKGVLIDVTSDKVEVFRTSPGRLIVVASGEKYHAIGGTLVDGVQKAMLLSKPVLKTAEVVQPVFQPTSQPAPVEQYEHRNRPQHFDDRPRYEQRNFDQRDRYSEPRRESDQRSPHPFEGAQRREQATQRPNLRPIPAQEPRRPFVPARPSFPQPVRQTAEQPQPDSNAPRRDWSRPAGSNWSK